MIDWKKYPEAKSAVITFLNSTSGYVAHENIERPTQTKTVEDAVEKYNGKWQHKDYKFLHWLPNDGWLFTSDGKYFGRSESQVCTRDEFEAYVKEQEGEKWTHICDGDKCRWLGDKPDLCNEMAIQYESGEYGLVNINSLEPIKPTLTKAEAWDRCKEEFGVRNIKYVMQKLMDEYDII